MPRSTSVITVRVQHAVSDRVRAAAQATGRTVNRYVNDLLVAMVGGCR